MIQSVNIGLVEDNINQSVIKSLNDKFIIESLSTISLYQQNFDTESFIASIDFLFIYQYNIAFKSIIEQCIKKSKHIYIHHFDMNDANLIRNWLHLSLESQSYFHIGTKPYYYNFYRNLHQYITTPKYIEINNLYNNSDYLICNLMQHDISFVQHIIRADLKTVSVGGMTKVEKNPDIANARLEYNNACIANLTVNKISLHQEYTITIFQKENTIKIDFIKQQIEIINQHHKESITIDVKNEALLLVENFEQFITSAKNKSIWYNSLDIYYENLQIALEIGQKIERISGFSYVG